jgi:CRISPR-associated endoribonuclease Cas6
MTDLVRVIVPGRWAGDEEVTDFPGRALQAWFYRELATRSEQLASALHDTSTEKPFHLAMVRGETPFLVIGAYGPLAGPVLDIADRLPRQILLNARWWEVSGDTQISTATWQELAACLLAGLPRRTVRLTFVTPTTFRSAGNYLPLPTPQALFLSLFERWQSWSPIDLGPGVPEAVQRIAIRRHRVQSVAVQLKGLITAFVGTAEFEMRERIHPYVGLLELLSRFATYSGVGAKVSTGFGCVVLGDRPSSRAPEQAS